MAEYKAEFIKIPTHATDGYQTMPVEPSKRLKNEEIQIGMMTIDESDDIAELLYACFGEAAWSRLEPTELRPPEFTTRVKRMSNRFSATFAVPKQYWVKAIYTPTGQTVGIAGWMAPGNPVYNPCRRAAVEFYGFKDKMGWSDEDIEEMWKGVSLEAWDGQFGNDDKVRKELLGDEPHWFLGPLLTLPEFQGRGVGTKLLNWAIEKADAADPPTPLYLESSARARAVYMHCGFVPQGAVNMVRRGPAIVKGLEAEEGEGEVKAEKVNVEVVANETEADLAS